MKGSSLLGNLLGNSQNQNMTAGISHLASQQMVNGLFAIIKSYEQQNSSDINKALKH